MTRGMPILVPPDSGAQPSTPSSEPLSASVTVSLTRTTKRELEAAAIAVEATTSAHVRALILAKLKET